MSQISRTLSFFKRNGFVPTMYATMERLGWCGPDPEQIRANEYYGSAEKTEYVKVEERMPGMGAQNGADGEPEEHKEYRFSIVVPAYETNVIYFKEMVNSVCSQTYPKWQLVIADASKSDTLEKVMESYEDERICYVRLKENKGISENTNEAMKYADGDYIGLLDHDDTLHSNALAQVAKLLRDGEYELVYTDEDKINEDGTIRFEPNFKPDFNFDFLLSNNYICHFTVLSRQLMEKLSFRPAFNGAQDYDLFLQAVYEIEQDRKNKEDESYIPYAADYMKKKIGHVPEVLYHWRAHMASTADNPESKRYAYEAGKRALENFAARNGWDVEVEHTKHLGFYDVKYQPDIFAVRKDVMAVCGKKVRFGKVTEGPVLEENELFKGMNARYSGYMHKAVLKFDVDSAPDGCIRYRETEAFAGKNVFDGNGGSGEKEADGMRQYRMVYLPDFETDRTNVK